MKHIPLLIAVVLGAVVTSIAETADSALGVRVQNFVVNPSTGPVGGVIVKNRSGTPYAGVMRLQFPSGWKVAPSQFDVRLAAGEKTNFNFTVESATDVEANSYTVGISLDGACGKISFEQKVVCASAPYFKPRIDGNLDEWKDSIPITFTSAGRKTVARAYWNNNQFCLALEVEEEKLVGLADRPRSGFMDAVQFALTPAGPSGNKNGQAVRYEFLGVASGSMWSADKCFMLTGTVRESSAAGERRRLKGLELKGSEIAVKRRGMVTRYEISVPFAVMPEIQPAPGREICFGLLAHDPDGTGLRDMGEIMNLWEENRTPDAWCSWDGVRWGEKIPSDGRMEFGFCSSIH